MIVREQRHLMMNVAALEIGSAQLESQSWWRLSAESDARRLRSRLLTRERNLSRARLNGKRVLRAELLFLSQLTVARPGRPHLSARSWQL